MPNDLTIETVEISALSGNPRNPRTHSRAQLRQIANSMRQFGFTNPVLIDERGRLIAGHGRLAATTQLGLQTVPAIRIASLSEPQKRALALADNKIAENAGWDTELLAQELEYLGEFATDFEVEITGFSPGEIDVLIDEAHGPGDDPRADEIPTPTASEESCVLPGDLWQLGCHRLLCGDATSEDAYARLMAGEVAQMVFTDPPYNVRIENNVSGLGNIRHQGFAMASGEMSEAEFIAFLRTVIEHLAACSGNGSIHFICMDWRHLRELLDAARGGYTELKNICVWSKTNAGMGALYRSQHELVCVFKSGSGRHVNNVELGKHGRNRSNVWSYPGMNSLQPGRAEELSMHPTVKPVALVADAIKDCSRRGGLVLDPFAGSGTTVVAAEQTGRSARAMEIDPGYVETALRRWEAYTDESAIHSETGFTLAELREARSTADQPENGDREEA